MNELPRDSKTLSFVKHSNAKSPSAFNFQDYELQLMTYRAFVESQQKSPVKRRRMLSSSDAITQEVRGLLAFQLQPGGGRVGVFYYYWLIKTGAGDRGR